MKTYEELAENVLKRRDVLVARRNKRNKVLKRCVCIASGLCIALLAGVGVWSHRHLKKDHSPWPIRQVEVMESELNPASVIIPRWEEQTLGQRYTEVRYHGSSYYCTRNTVITDREMIGDRLTSATLFGEDVYTDTIYWIKAEVYSIQKISNACALALRFEDSEDYYVYVNFYYHPDTLRQMMDDLNLWENLSFGPLWYKYRKSDNKPATVKFEEPDEQIIWNLLLSNMDAKDCYADIPDGKSCLMSVSTNVPILGYQNISLGVTADGYLVTNILDTGKYFWIGEEAVQQFVNYVLENCEGYEIQYVYPSDLSGVVLE